MIRYRLSDHHPRTPAGAGDGSYPHFPSFASRHAGDSEGRALRAATLARQRCTTPRITLQEATMILLFWPIYLTARAAQWASTRTQNAAIREAAWANAVAAEKTGAAAFERWCA